MWLEKGHRVFVFGSNLLGRHFEGSALHALKFYGAVYGQGDGWQGEAYAIPVRDRELRVLPPPEVYEWVRRFVRFARANPTMTFLVSEVGCGSEGYDATCMAPMFHDCPPNCQLSDRFKEILGKARTARGGGVVKKGTP